MYYNIVVARPFDRVFTYEADDPTLKLGQIVIVPFGKTMEVGMIMEGDVVKPEYTIKKINTVLEGLQLSDINIKFLKWVSEYTLAPIGSVLKLFIINKDIVSSLNNFRDNFDFFYIYNDIINLQLYGKKEDKQ